MLSSLERWVYFLDMYLKPHPEDAPKVFLPPLMPSLMSRVSKGDAFMYLNNRTAAARITDCRMDASGEFACLLVQYADTAATDPVFSDLETGTIRVEPKLDGEGVAVSAHVAVSLKQAVKHEPVYLVLLEQVPGVNRTLLSRFLQREFKDAAKHLGYRYTNSEGKSKRCWPKIDLTGHPSPSFKEDIIKGRLRSIELIDRRHKNGDLDEEGYLYETARVVNVKVTDALKGNKALHILNQLKAKALNNGYGEMRVRLRENDKDRTVNISTQVQDVAMGSYVRSERIVPKQPLSQCATKINEEIEMGLIKMLKSIS